MKHLCLFLSFLTVVSWSQEKSQMKTKFIIGETSIEIFEHNAPNQDSIIFINVHEDEVTSIETLRDYSKLDSIRYFYLQHLETRRIKFELKGEEYNFDPNRIFTKKGRKKTLKDGDNYSSKANKAVKALAKEIIGRIPEDYTVVAVHNNTDVNYSIKSYEPGGGEAENTAEVYVNPDMDADDFIYTTDKRFYDAFKKRKVNVILQDNKGYVNDGSLSVYCGKRGIPYINIETQKGHYEEQMSLMRITLDVIRGA